MHGKTGHVHILFILKPHRTHSEQLFFHRQEETDMKKLFLAMLVILCAGCAVNAENSAVTYTATVIENSEEGAVLELDETENTDETADEESPAYDEFEYQDGKLSVGSDQEVLLFNDERMIDFCDLKKNQKVSVTLNRRKAVIHVIDSETELNEHALIDNRE